MFSFYFRKVVSSPVTLISAVILFLALLFSSVSMSGDIFESLGGPLYSFQYVCAVGIVYYFLPVVTALPICYIQYEMITKKAECFFLYRSRPKRYIFSGIAAAGISGAVVTLISFALFIGYCTATGGASLMSQVLHEFEGTCFANASARVLYLREAFVFACNGALWPVIAFTIFCFTKNQYIATAAPLILRSGGTYIIQRISYHIDATELTILDYIDSTMIKGEGSIGNFSDSGIMYIVLYVTAAIIICTVLSCLKMHRRRVYG
ncbi:MAG: hypothetical protein Q4F21_12495 [Lachnospiraceae bacterium]|nr:hypothetical protein [Lachnospiraceae bacterium]